LSGTGRRLEQKDERAEVERLDRAVERLMQAQREALESCEHVLDYDDEILDDADALMEVPGRRWRRGGSTGWLLKTYVLFCWAPLKTWKTYWRRGDGGGN
jgi:hypothetical protein